MTNVAGIVNVPYTSGSPTGSGMYAYFGYAAGQLADGRKRPPEVWLARTARWAAFTTSEDTAGLPFGLPSPFFMGNTADTPDPVGGLLGHPLFEDEAIPATLGTGANQDEMILLRPSDLLFFEGQVQTNVFTQVLSGSMGARIQMHNRVAAITNRYASGIALVGGTGFVVGENF